MWARWWNGGADAAWWAERAGIWCACALSLLVLGRVLRRLGKILPCRVNCWFCNGNFWIRFPERNCWTCETCDQYNGFTKDGDYNRPLPNGCEPLFKTPKPVDHITPKNGLCKMCNINQQLKVAQLANFVPMNEKTFDREVQSYRSQLEKAYRLCSRCRKYLRSKLHKEKETLLGSKLIENRSPKKVNPKEKQSEKLTNFIKYFALSIASALVILITMDCYEYSMKYNSVRTTVMRTKQMVYSLTERLTTIVVSTVFLTFPSLHDYEDISYSTLQNWQEFLNRYTHLMPKPLPNYYECSGTIQMALAGIGCFTQLFCHVLNRKTVRYENITDLLWALIIVSSMARTITPLALPIKLCCATALFFLYKNVKSRLNQNEALNGSVQGSPKRMKNLAREKDDSWSKDDSSDLETDDDVSLSQFGIHNTDSSNDSKMSKQSLMNGRGVHSSYMKNGNPWDIPNLNSTFDSNPTFGGSQVPYMVSPQTCYAVSPGSIFAKPQFSSCQNTENNDSDSDLDEFISGLHLGTSPKKSRKNNNIFSIKQFNATSPSFAAPSVVGQRPLISPSKLGQGTSWVAGGYWGAECKDPTIYNVNCSRSSSQSSGFESHASSMNQKNLFSHPPSREDSVCSEFDRISVFSDPIPNHNQFYFNSTKPYNGFQQNLFANRLKSPIHPQMRYDGHVHMPQPLPAHQMFAHSHPYVGYPGARLMKTQHQNMIFPPASGGSLLIKLPHSMS